MRGVAAVCMGLLGMAWAWPVGAQPLKEPDPNVMRLGVYDAYAQTAKAGGSSAISMLLVNPASATLVLVGASTPLASQTLLQTYTHTSQGLAQIKPLNNLNLPPKREVVLAPGVLELQLVGLQTDLEPGLELPLKLKFSDGTERVVRIQIKGD